MYGKNRVLIDVLAGGSLAFILLLIFLIDRLTSGPAGIGPNTLEVDVISAGGRTDVSKKLRLAVTPSEVEIHPQTGMPFPPWDDMSRLLRELGEGYQFDEVQPVAVAANARSLDNYDVLFLTCAKRRENLTNILREFVNRGGTLYASDWRYETVAEAFPDFVDKTAFGSGVRGDVHAEVVDAGLKDFVGPSIPLRFDLDMWKTAGFGGPRVTTLLRGSYRKQRHPKDRFGDPATAPLLVKFQVGKGTVIFTSFHTEKQNSAVERKLLQYLVFTLVVADIDAKVAASIEEAGFAPQKSNLLSTPREDPTVTRKYLNSKQGPLRFSLGFRDAGAKLRLQIQSPDGRSYTWEGTSTVTLEVPRAVVGEWTYIVTALHLPYENFPFTVTVSEKK
jgi:hypothetical protein